jgi:protein O-GlcNAc transferase
MTHPQAFSVAFSGRSAKFILFDANEHIHHQLLHSRRFYEEDLLSAIYHRAMPDSAMIDVGANIGNHAIFFASVIGGKVYSYEPHPTNFKRLTENIKVNELEHLISAKNIAIGATEGVCDITTPHPENMGQCVVQENASGKCVVKPLDAFKFDTKISFLKIDVEGAELQVLQGATQTISQHCPYIFIEAHDGQAFAEICATLNPLGYKPKRRFCFTPTYMFEPQL